MRPARSARRASRRPERPRGTGAGRGGAARGGVGRRSRWSRGGSQDPREHSSRRGKGCLVGEDSGITPVTPVTSQGVRDNYTRVIRGRSWSTKSTTPPQRHRFAILTPVTKRRGRQTAFEARVEQWRPDLEASLGRVYGADAAGGVADRLVALARAAHDARPDDLRALDERRLAEPDWFQLPSMIGYAAYADRFAGTLADVGRRASYLEDLGVGYLHLMPLLTPRPAPNDGGYAVMDYRSVRSDLGTVDDLRALTTTLRERGHQPVPRPRAQPRGPRARLGGRGPGRATRRSAPTSTSTPTARCRTPTRPACPRCSPTSRPATSPGTTTSRLGVDDVQRLPVGRQLGEPLGAVRVRRHHRRPGQPRGRGVPPRRDRLPLEADGHGLPEPARGARPDAGPAHRRPDGLPGGDLQGRGDRRARRPAGVPRGRSRTRARSATSPTTTG